MLYVGHLEQVAQASGAAGGLVIMALTYGRARPATGLRASQHEVRVLIGMLVAVSALGSMLAALIQNADGPMSTFSFLFAAPGPDPHDLAATCARAGLAVVCRGLREQQLYAHWPGVFVQVAPALLLLLSADGLRRGRRLAWRLAVAINVTVLGVSIWVGYTVAANPSVHISGFGAWARAILLAGEAMLLPVVTLVVLLATRRHFDQTADRRAVRKLTATLVTALAASCGAFVLLGYLLRDHFSPRPEFGLLVQDLPLRFVAGRPFSTPFLPADLAGQLLYVWIFLLFWIAALAALTAFFLHTCTYRDADTADRARAILTRGGSTLSYMSTWPGNQYWISNGGQAAIAYRAIAGVAVTVGGPYGDPAALDSAIAEFARFCEHRGLQPCLYGVNAQTRAVTDLLGWKSVQVAEDTLLTLAGSAIRGQEVAGRADRAEQGGQGRDHRGMVELPGGAARAHQPDPADLTEMAGGQGLARDGLHAGRAGRARRPERPLPDRSRRGPQGPRHHELDARATRDGRPDGWTLDFMRRNTEPGSFHGVMEFLIATAALDLPGGGRPLRQPVRRAAGPAGPRRTAVRAAAPSRHDRQHHGTGVWLPVAAALQGQVPAGLPAALPDLPGSGRTRLDRHRDRPRLSATPHVPAGPAPARQASRPHARRGPVPQSEGGVALLHAVLGPPSALLLQLASSCRAARVSGCSWPRARPRASTTLRWRSRAAP